MKDLTKNRTAAVPIMDAAAVQRALRRIAHEITRGNPNFALSRSGGNSIARG